MSKCPKFKILFSAAVVFKCILLCCCATGGLGWGQANKESIGMISYSFCLCVQYSQRIDEYGVFCECSFERVICVSICE